MSGFISKLLIGSIIFSSLALFGCSSDGGDGGSAASPTASVSYSGLSTPSAVNSANAKALTTTGGEAVQHAADSSSARALGVEISTDSHEAEMLAANLASAMASASPLAVPSGFTMSGSCGGSMTIPDDQLSAFGAESGPASFTATYTDYCDASFGAQYTINGQVTFDYVDIGDLNTGFTVQYKDVTFNDGSETATINMTVDCSSATDCTVLSDYVGNDGSTHRVADISVFGDATNGYNGSATFYHPDHGSVSITAISVTYGSCGSFPDGGSVTASGTTGTAQIDFNTDCTYAISFDDGAGDTGVINGSFK